MADIAMLVAEEYERRVKNSDEKIGLMSCVGFLGQNLKGSFNKEKIFAAMEEEKVKLIKGILAPEYQISIAASNGFFSA